MRSALLGGGTIGEALDKQHGAGAGFDALRFILAFAIFYGHTKWASGSSGMGFIPGLVASGHDAGGGALNFAAATTTAATMFPAWTGWTRPLKLVLVPMFFALSGFLVMGSADRLRATPTFLAHRALRIFPALMVEVTLSALILGPMLTVLPLRAYFTDWHFFRYFGNAVGHISFKLPGVFLTNPGTTSVNVNLWTLPSELYCYIILATLMLTRVAYNRTVATVLIVVLSVVLAGFHAATGMSTPHGPFPPHVVVWYFLLGLTAFHWRHAIPRSWLAFALAFPIAYGCLTTDTLIYLAAPAIVYITVFFGVLPIPRSRLLSSGDYSYGVYLYGFPIAQSLVAMFPKVFVHHAILLVSVSAAITSLFAVLSWHGVEKHALALKRRLPQAWFPTPKREQRFAIAATIETARAER